MLTKHQFFALGTRIRVAVEANQPLDLIALAEDWLKQEEEIYSLHSPTSLLSTINRSAGKVPVPCPPQLLRLIELGKKASLHPQSQLNIAIAPLVKAWQIGFSDARLPSPDEIAELLPLCQPEQIELDSTRHTVFLKQEGMALDLGGLAKGYLADLLWKNLSQAGAKSALIDFGSTILIKGQTKQVGLQIPFAEVGKSLGQVRINDKAITTSGIYQRFFEENGQSYHHILDPKIGYPIQTELPSLTIISPTALDGEILTSQLFGQEIDGILQEVEKIDQTEAILLTQEKQLFMTSGARQLFTPLYHA